MHDIARAIIAELRERGYRPQVIEKDGHGWWVNQFYAGKDRESVVRSMRARPALYGLPVGEAPGGTPRLIFSVPRRHKAQSHTRRHKARPHTRKFARTA